MKPGVLIPVYNLVPDANELLALKNNLLVLAAREIVFIHPEGLDLTFYQSLCPEAKFEAFEKHFFSGVSGYNELMLSHRLYNRFMKYPYILILQMDAWVFEDRLDYWMSQKYDYIGAPDYTYKTQPSSWHNRVLGRHLMNGGFSLRKTRAMIKALHWYDKYYRKGYQGFEDSFFSAHFSRFLPMRFVLNLPDYQTALTFGFEKAPTQEFALNHNRMPFGCHAYLKFEPDFWKSKGVKIV